MNTLLLPASFASTIGGLLVPLIGHQGLFALCFCICLVAFRIATGLQEIMHEDEFDETDEA